MGTKVSGGWRFPANQDASQRAWLFGNERGLRESRSAQREGRVPQRRIASRAGVRPGSASRQRPATNPSAPLKPFEQTD